MNRTDGIALLRERVALSQQRLCAQWREPLGSTNRVAFPWVLTGIGSSEAHARYLAVLANQMRPGSALFVPTSAFALNCLPAATNAAALIVFTQGISSNAQIALTRRAQFRETVLFTAATADTLRRGNKSSALAIWEALVAEKQTVVATPEPDEYTILLRVVGPLCGYLSALQWFQTQVPGAFPSPDPNWPKMLAEAVAELPGDFMRALTDDFMRGVEFNFLGGVSEYAQNLAYKRVEGLFLEEPVRRDLLQFAHGPFQQNFASATAQWVFTQKGPEQRALVERLWPMFLRLSEPPQLISSPIPEPYSIFHYEMLLNRVLFESIEDCPHCQIHWPGKGLDGEGYGLNRPIAPVH